MNYSPLLTPIVLSAVVLLGLGFFGLRFRTTTTAPVFIIFCFVGTGWLVFYGLSLAAPTIASALDWYKARLLMAAFLPPLIGGIALSHTARTQWLRGWRLLLFLLPSFLIASLVISTQVDPADSSAYTVSFRYGVILIESLKQPWQGLLATFTLLVAFVAALALIDTLRMRPYTEYQRQSLVLLIALFVAIVPYALSVAGITLLPGYNPLLYVMPVVALLMAWVLFRYHLLELQPIARRSVFDQIADAVAVIDSGGRLVDMNHSMVRIIGEPRPDYGDPAHAAFAAFPVLERLLAAGAGSAVDQVTAHDGRCFEATITTLDYGQPVRAGMLLTLHDITDRNAAEQAAQQAQSAELDYSQKLTTLYEIGLDLARAPSPDELLRTAVAAAHDRLHFDRIGIWLADVDRLDFMYGTYGIDEHGNLRDERDRILPVDGHNVLEAWVGTVDLSGDLLIHLADQNLYDDQHGIVGRGDLVYTSLSDSQKIIGFISVDNLFSHKPFDQLQQQILVLFARQLGTLYELKCTQATLQETSLRADAANRAKSAFLASMSHEIRTPMNAVIGMTNLLLDTPLTAEQQDFVETIRRGGDALLAVINDVLDFSKIESGKMEVDAHPFDLLDLVEDTAELFAAAAYAKRLDLLVHVAPAAAKPRIGDAIRIQQVLVNLVGNAVKFTDHGAIVATVTLADEAECKAHGMVDAAAPVHITVIDSGIGIDADRLDQIFLPFVQADASMTRKYGGTGLGLVISQRLVNLMGGAIWVESESGAGTRFHVLLDLPALADAALERAGDPPLPANARALLIADSVPARQIRAAQLAEWRIATNIAADDNAASAAPPPVDFMLFDLTGANPVAQHQAHAGRHAGDSGALPAIFLVPPSADPPEAIGPAQQVVLRKPVRQQQLRTAIAALLAGNTPSRSRQAPSPFDGTLAARNPLRILLAEDNLVNQKVATQTLARFGYTVDVVANGCAAVDALAQHTYDLVLMDIQMPQMDGLEATRTIRSRGDAFPQPIIIAMTAAAAREDQDACMAAGMDGFVSKPFKPDRLLAILESVTLEKNRRTGTDHADAPHLWNQAQP